MYDADSHNNANATTRFPIRSYLSAILCRGNLYLVINYSVFAKLLSENVVNA